MSKDFRKYQSVQWHILFKFGWNVGKIFTIEGVYRKINGFGMNDDNYSTYRYFRVSRSTVRRAIEKMIVSGEIRVVKKNYNCYDRIKYELIDTCPF